MAHKAEALAIYARQATDKQLLFFARRIQARACRRCGELLREYRGQVGRRKIVEGALPNSPQTRASAATQAGLSEHQRKTVLRLAAIPEADFEDAVEGPSPPTVTALATQGVWRTRRRPPPSSVIDATTDLIVDFSYPRDLSLSEIATERQLAVLMHAWRSAENEARRRFLDLLGLTATQIADFAT